MARKFTKIEDDILKPYHIVVDSYQYSVYYGSNALGHYTMLDNALRKIASEKTKDKKSVMKINEYIEDWRSIYNKSLDIFINQ